MNVILWKSLEQSIIFRATNYYYVVCDTSVISQYLCVISIVCYLYQNYFYTLLQSSCNTYLTKERYISHYYPLAKSLTQFLHYRMKCQACSKTTTDLNKALNSHDLRLHRWWCVPVHPWDASYEAVLLILITKRMSLETCTQTLNTCKRFVWCNNVLWIICVITTFGTQNFEYGMIFLNFWLINVINFKYTIKCGNKS